MPPGRRNPTGRLPACGSRPCWVGTATPGAASPRGGGCWTGRSRTIRDGEATTAALVVAGIVAWAGDELDRAAALLTKGLERCEHDDDLRRATIAAAFLGHVARAGGRYAEAARWHQRAELGYRRLDNPQGSAWVRYDLGLLARDRGDLAVAEQWLREGLREFRDLDYPWAVASTAWGLGFVLEARGALDEAATLLGEALALYRDLHDTRGVAQCLEALGYVACGRADHVSAARLLGYAAAQRTHLAAPLAEADRTRTAAVEQALTRVLGPVAAEQARQDGRRMSASQAVELGRAVEVAGRWPDRCRPGRPPHRPLCSLGARPRSRSWWLPAAPTARSVRLWASPRRPPRCTCST